MLSGSLIKDLSKHKDFILDIIFKCVLALPTKTPIYATLISLMNVSQPEIGKEVLRRVHDEIGVSLKRNESYNLKFLTRFLCELANSNVVNVDCIFDMFELFLSEDTSVPQGRRDFFLVLVMGSIPFCGNLLQSSNSKRLASLFDILGVKTANRNKEMNLCVSIFTNNESEPVSVINWLYDALSDQAKQKWSVMPVVYAPWNYFKENLSAVEPHNWITVIGTDKSGSGFELPPIDSKDVYPVYHCQFRLLEKEVHALWKERNLSDLERYIISDYVTDLIHFFSDTPKDCVHHILKIPVQPKIDNVLDIITETIFFQLLTIPQAEYPRSYYSLLLIELCKASSEYMPGILSKCVLLIYDRLEYLDVECYHIFIDWFASYLSNFDFKWIWTQWKSPKTPTQQNFISQLLIKCIRLSYYEKIDRTVPTELSQFLPPKSRPDFKYLKGSSVIGYKAAQQMYVRLKKEETSEQIISWIESPEGATINEQSQIVITDIIVSCILQVSVKGLSSLYAIVTKYLPLLKKFITNLETEKQAVLSISEFWQSNTQNIVIAVQKFQSSQILTAQAIAEWLFMPANFRHYNQQWIWEILSYATAKTVSEVKLLHNTVSSLEDAINRSTATEEEKLQYKEASDKYAIEIKKQKDLFLVIFESFETVLKDNINLYKKLHFKKTDDDISEEDDNDRTDLKNEYLNSLWITITLGQFKSIGRKYFRDLHGLCSKTFDILFSDSEPQISSCYEQFKALVINYN